MLSTAYHLMNKCLSSFAAARLLLARRTKPPNLHGFMATILFFNTIRNPSCTRHFFFADQRLFVLFCFVLFFLMIAMDSLWFSRWELTCTINCIQNSYINLGQNTGNPTTENLHSGVLYFCNQIFLVVGSGWGKTPKIMKELLLHSS